MDIGLVFVGLILSILAALVVLGLDIDDLKRQMRELEAQVKRLEKTEHIRRIKKEDSND